MSHQLSVRPLVLKDGFYPFFEIEAFHDDYEGVRTLVRGTKDGRVWRVAFPRSMSYRSCADSDALLLTSLAIEAKCGLVVVEGDSWAREFCSSGTGAVWLDKLIHIALVGANQIVEVLTYGEPEVVALQDQ